MWLGSGGEWVNSQQNQGRTGAKRGEQNTLWYFITGKGIWEYLTLGLADKFTGRDRER